MPSRSPEVRLEVLESRFAPARLLAGPQPAQFGADLADASIVPQIEVVTDTQSFIGESIPDGPLTFNDGGLSGVTTTVLYGGTLSGGVIKAGAGTLALGGTLTFANQGYILDPSLAAGSLTLVRPPVQVLEFPGTPSTYTAHAGSFDPGATLDLTASGTITAGGTLVVSGGTLSLGYPNYSSVTINSGALLMANASVIFSASTLRISSLAPLWNGFTLLKTPAQFVNVDGPALPDDAVITTAPIPLSLGSA